MNNKKGGSIPLRVDILTLFPGMFDAVLQESILKRAQEKGALQIQTVNIRDFSENKHLQVDDYPYGGGAGMLMKADVVIRALKSVENPQAHVVYLSPQGRKLNTQIARELSEYDHLVFLCGHYEGIDERVMKKVDEEISIGDYVLTGGELPAMVLLDAVARFVPGVLGDAHSAEEESFSDDLLEYPQYTRPEEVEGETVPAILLSGHHKNIERWRKQQSLLRTLLKRPEILLKHSFDEEEEYLLCEILFGRIPEKKKKRKSES